MVVVKIFAGLGNQMFQYAFGKGYELKTGGKVFFEANWLEDRELQGEDTARELELNVFKANINFLESSILKSILKRKSIPQRIAYRILSALKILNFLEEEKLFTYDEELFLKFKGISHIQGYFQTESYFKEFREEILKDFKIKNKLSPNSTKYKELIQASNSVCLQVRRRHYVTNPKANKTHDVCGLDYYERAASHIIDKVENPMFFVFSDDLDWVKQQEITKGAPVTYVSGNIGDFSFEDMILMQYCKHNIIANSSFSWWGAWLNTNKDKIVIAPQKWTTKTETKECSVIPKDWLII